MAMVVLLRVACVVAIGVELVVMSRVKSHLATNTCPAAEMGIPFAALCAVVALIHVTHTARNVAAHSVSTSPMHVVEHAMQEASRAFLMHAYPWLAACVTVVAVLLVCAVNTATAAAFITGASLSAATGWLGMALAVRGHMRIGAVVGTLVAALGLLGACAVFSTLRSAMVQNTLADASHNAVGFVFGASIVALFVRVGGGIFAHAAEVGADITEGVFGDDANAKHHPTCTSVVLKAVGHNVCDAVGSGADFFESHIGAVIAAGILGREEHGARCAWRHK